MSRSPMSRSPAEGATTSRTGFAARLLAGQALVLAAGAFTTWLVASAIGPGIFRGHLSRAGIHHTTSEAGHVEEAFGSSLLISVSVALVAAGVAALAVSWWISRRVQRSITAVAASAAEIAAGRRGARVPDPGLGREFESLATTYNALAERLEATEAGRRRMLADLAHEMRTPLATIEAHLEAIEDGVRAVDAETLAVLRGSTHRLGRLAEDIAAVSHAEEGALAIARRRVAAGDLARAATAAAAGRFAAARVDLRSEVSCEEAVEVDPDRIGQVLSNLLDNALRHTPAGGTVTLGCHRVEGEVVEYDVADTGEGIAPEHLPHVFERFYRADTARDRGRGGSGIGLSIARALVEAHGGSIGVVSAGPGRGATFTVRLPLATMP